MCSLSMRNKRFSSYAVFSSSLCRQDSWHSSRGKLEHSLLNSIYEHFPGRSPISVCLTHIWCCHRYATKSAYITDPPFVVIHTLPPSLYLCISFSLSHIQHTSIYPSWHLVFLITPHVQIHSKNCSPFHSHQANMGYHYGWNSLLLRGAHDCQRRRWGLVPHFYCLFCFTRRSTQLLLQLRILYHGNNCRKWSDHGANRHAHILWFQCDHDFAPLSLACEGSMES